MLSKGIIETDYELLDEYECQYEEMNSGISNILLYEAWKINSGYIYDGNLVEELVKLRTDLESFQPTRNQLSIRHQILLMKSSVLYCRLLLFYYCKTKEFKQKDELLFTCINVAHSAVTRYLTYVSKGKHIKNDMLFQNELRFAFEILINYPEALVFKNSKVNPDAAALLVWQVASQFNSDDLITIRMKVLYMKRQLHNTSRQVSNDVIREIRTACHAFIEKSDFYYLKESGSHHEIMEYLLARDIYLGIQLYSHHYSILFGKKNSKDILETIKLWDEKRFNEYLQFMRTESLNLSRSVELLETITCLPIYSPTFLDAVHTCLASSLQFYYGHLDTLAVWIGFNNLLSDSQLITIYEETILTMELLDRLETLRSGFLKISPILYALIMDIAKSSSKLLSISIIITGIHEMANINDATADVIEKNAQIILTNSEKTRSKASLRKKPEPIINGKTTAKPEKNGRNNKQGIMPSKEEIPLSDEVKKLLELEKTARIMKSVIEKNITALNESMKNRKEITRAYNSAERDQLAKPKIIIEKGEEKLNELSRNYAALAANCKLSEYQLANVEFEKSEFNLIIQNIQQKKNESAEIYNSMRLHRKMEWQIKCYEVGREHLSADPAFKNMSVKEICDKGEMIIKEQSKINRQLFPESSSNYYEEKKLMESLDLFFKRNNHNTINTKETLIQPKSLKK